MKNRILIALAVGILLSLTSFAIPVQKDAPSGRVFIADTGIVPLGLNQVLRITCVNKNGNASATIRFRRLEYAQGPGNSGVTTYSSVTDLILDPLQLMPGEGASLEIPNTASGVRGMILSSSQNVEVLCVVFDTSTQRIVSVWDDSDLLTAGNL